MSYFASFFSALLPLASQQSSDESQDFHICLALLTGSISQKPARLSATSLNTQSPCMLQKQDKLGLQDSDIFVFLCKTLYQFQSRLVKEQDFENKYAEAKAQKVISWLTFYAEFLTKS